MSAPAIQRLNYFNGQRLEAGDFKIERSYHIDIRHRLNRSLFTSGIAEGLEVEVKPGDAHKVIVSPGLALDSLGREIILVEPVDFAVTGFVTEKPGDPVIGNYLIIQYIEEAVAELRDSCAVRLPAAYKASEDLKWGAPSRILARGDLSWENKYPKTEENKIVLAQVELDKDCSVRDIRKFVRKNVGVAQPARVRPLALEGEKEIDNLNAKDLYFHIEGGLPDRAVLYLRAAKFSTLYYTELGVHTHTLKATLDPATKNLQHSHKLAKDAETEDDGVHSHDYFVDKGETSGGLDVNDDQDRQNNRRNTDISAIIDSQPHHHRIVKEKMEFDKGTYDDGVPVWTHTHLINVQIDPAGVTGAPAIRTSAALTYFDDLRIKFEDIDITSLVLTQLQERDGLGPWEKLGDGGPTHQLVTQGTGEIDLLRLGIDLTPGEHKLVFSVPPNNNSGGKIQYNLYID
jgi:hypothetical protein